MPFAHAHEGCSAEKPELLMSPKEKPRRVNLFIKFVIKILKIRCNKKAPLFYNSEAFFALRERTK